MCVSFACIHTVSCVCVLLLPAFAAVVARCVMSQHNSNPIGCFPFFCVCVFLFQIVWLTGEDEAGVEEEEEEEEE